MRKLFTTLSIMAGAMVFSSFTPVNPAEKGADHSVEYNLTPRTTKIAADQPIVIPAISAVANVKVKAKASSEKVGFFKKLQYQYATMKMAAKVSKAMSSDVSKGLLIVLCFVIPWLAVGLATDWDWTIVIYNILWTLLCWIPGVIHALIVVNREA